MTKLFHILLLILLTQGCGSVFIAAPEPHPDFDTCYEFSDEMSSATNDTIVPLPFAGRRKTTLRTRLPENWDLFHGSIHLVGLSWTGADWVSSMRLYVEYLLVARWDGNTWETFPNQDLRPALSVITRNSSQWLQFEAKASSEGIKPAGSQHIVATVTVQLCGDGAEYVTPFGQPFEAD